MLDRRFAAGLLFGFLCSLVLAGNVPPAVQAQTPGSTQVCVGPVEAAQEDPVCIEAALGEGAGCETSSCERVLIDNIALDTGAPTEPGELRWGGSQVWTEANDGAGSGLNADTVDGLDSSALIPTGAVMAFDLATCPTGWTAFTAAVGRTVIGVGSGAGLTPRTLGATGGEERHTLTVSEMPSHAHGVYTSGEGQSGGAVGRPAFGGGVGGSTDSVGGGASHNVMDPFIALLYCKKL